jgi:drug/metabolite transporter superfamily protein YnfA
MVHRSTLAVVRSAGAWGRLLLIASLIIITSSLATLRAQAQPAPGSSAAGLRAGDWGAIRSLLPPGALGGKAYLKPSNTEEGDLFGVAVAADGDTVVVGAASEDGAVAGINGDDSSNGAQNSGAAYVFVRSQGAWVQQAYLKASNPDEGDNFGWAVAISGDTIVVGAPYEDSGAPGVGGDQGNAIADSGAAYVFVRNGATWTQQAYLKASNTDAQDFFGMAVAIDGDTIVAGSIWENSAARGIDGDGADNSAPHAGAGYVFVRTDSGWSQQAYLKAANTDQLDSFGGAVAVAGDTIVIGAWRESSAATGVNSDQDDNSAPLAGAAYVLVRSGTTWSQQAYLKAANTDAEDYFGHLVAIAGETIVVTATAEDSAASGVNGDDDDNSAENAGAAYVFVRTDSGWSQQAYLKASNPDADDDFGSALAIAGDRIVVAAGAEDSAARTIDGDQADDSAINAGAAYVFVRAGTDWSQSAYLKAPNADRIDDFGRAAALTDEMIVIGAIGEESSATGVNGNPADNSAFRAGAAYIFGNTAPTPAKKTYLPLLQAAQTSR